MGTAGKHVCSICVLTNVYICMFTIVPSQQYVNTRFHSCPTAGKVNQGDGEKSTPGGGSLSFVSELLLSPVRGGEGLPSIKTAFGLYFCTCDCKAQG